MPSWSAAKRESALRPTLFLAAYVDIVMRRYNVVRANPARGNALFVVFSGLSLCSTGACLQVPPALPVVRPTADRCELASAAHGFPSLRSASGTALAQGEFRQWLEDEVLHVRIRYEFDASHWIEESSRFRLDPRLEQLSWSWQERRADALLRGFELDLRTGAARVEKLVNGERREWRALLEVEPGRVFAGAGFTLAVQDARRRLLDGETVELQAVGFTPQPTLVIVEVSHDGLDRMTMGGLAVSGDRFLIHPKINWLVGMFVDAPDSVVWLTHDEPASFLRWEGPLAEPGDDVVRVDLLPGEHSSDAIPFED